MADIFDSAYVPDRAKRTDPLVTAELDLLQEEGDRYAERLAEVGAQVEHHVVAGADHGYDGTDDEKALQTYALIARHLREPVS